MLYVTLTVRLTAENTFFHPWFGQFFQHPTGNSSFQQNSLWSLIYQVMRCGSVTFPPNLQLSSVCYMLPWGYSRTYMHSSMLVCRFLATSYKYSTVHQDRLWYLIWSSHEVWEFDASTILSFMLSVLYATLRIQRNISYLLCMGSSLFLIQSILFCFVYLVYRLWDTCPRCLRPYDYNMYINYTLASCYVIRILP